LRRVALRTRFVQGNLFVFAKDVEFASPSAAAAIVMGGSAQGPAVWRNADGKSLKDIEAGSGVLSAAEYLNFVAAAGQGGVEAVFIDANVWLTQKMMVQLHDVNMRTVSEHLKAIFADTELQEDSVMRKFRITAADGKSYITQHYNLAAIELGYLGAHDE
jgi:hypothetical protein